MTIHLLSSPPFGEYFWAPVQERLVQHGHDVCIHTPIENHSTLDKAREQLSLSITPEDDVVAHGLGVPLLLHFAHKYPLRTAVLSNVVVTRVVVSDVFLSDIIFTNIAGRFL